VAVKQEAFDVQSQMNTKPTVLIVEDDEAVSRMLTMALKSAGFEVDQAWDGHGALSKLENTNHDAVLLDLGLPDGGGPSVLETLRSWDKPGDTRPVWFVMSAIDFTDARAQHGLSREQFVPKPFKSWDLASRLYESLGEVR